MMASTNNLTNNQVPAIIHKYMFEKDVKNVDSLCCILSYFKNIERIIGGYQFEQFSKNNVIGLEFK